MCDELVKMLVDELTNILVLIVPEQYTSFAKIVVIITLLMLGFVANTVIKCIVNKYKASNKHRKKKNKSKTKRRK